MSNDPKIEGQSVRPNIYSTDGPAENELEVEENMEPGQLNEGSEEVEEGEVPKSVRIPKAPSAREFQEHITWRRMYRTGIGVSIASEERHRVISTAK